MREHPLIAAHGADAAAHLVGESLKAEAAIGRGQRAGDGGAGSVAPARQENVDGFFEAALQKVDVAARRESAAAASAVLSQRKMEAMDGVQEEQRAHALVEIVAACGGSGRARRIRPAIRPAGGAADSASSDRSRIAGSAAVMMSISAAHCRPPGRQFAVGQQFHQLRRAPPRGRGRSAPAPFARSAGHSARRGRSGGRSLRARDTVRRRASSASTPESVAASASAALQQIHDLGVRTWMPKKQR